jgi:large subunit ribosomal protein L19
MDVLKEFNQQQTKNIERPSLKAGDVVRVETKVTEGSKTRLQIFEGTVLAMRGSGPSKSFTVRRLTGGFGVERIFPLYSPVITAINIVRRQKVRRAKLTYLRASARRRVKDDVKAVQRHLKEELDKKRLAEEKSRREAKEKEDLERAAKRADLAAEASAKEAAETPKEEAKSEEKK